MVKTRVLSIVLLLASCLAWAAMKAHISSEEPVGPNGAVPVESAGTNVAQPGSTVVHGTARPMNQRASFAGEKSSRKRIVYIQLVRYKGITQARIEELLRSAERTLGMMPEVKAITAGRVARDSSESYDYALIMEFDSLSDLTAYGQSEVHRRWVEQNNVAPLIQNHLMLTIQPLSDQ